jgi:5-hydroxyisourate hydrolase-like protein (transthyretin family)
MKKINFYALLFVAIVMGVSCTKKQELDITMTQKMDGNLKVKLVNTAGSPLADVKLKLYEDYGSFIDELKTGSDGYVDFGPVLVGTYKVSFEDILIGTNNKKYTGYKIIQVINGTSKDVTINPEEYVGTFKVKVYNNDDYYNPVPYANVNIALIRYDDASELESSATFNTISALFVGGSQKTDANGNITFTNVPTGVYNVFFYLNTTQFLFDYYTIDLSKDETVSRSYSYEPSDFQN